MAVSINQPGDHDSLSRVENTINSVRGPRRDTAHRHDSSILDKDIGSWQDPAKGSRHHGSTVDQ
jgi:hypothetical protein